MSTSDEMISANHWKLSRAFRKNIAFFSCGKCRTHNRKQPVFGVCYENAWLAAAECKFCRSVNCFTYYHDNELMAAKINRSQAR